MEEKTPFMPVDYWGSENERGCSAGNAPSVVMQDGKPAERANGMRVNPPSVVPFAEIFLHLSINAPSVVSLRLGLSDDFIAQGSHLVFLNRALHRLL